MTTLVVVPCGKAKIWERKPNVGPMPARDVYVSSLFKVNREYAMHFGDAWVILSAKYGLLLPGEVIPGPYNVSFTEPQTRPVHVETLRHQVYALGLDTYDRVIALGGQLYSERVRLAFQPPGIPVETPFAGIGMLRALGATKQAVRDAVRASSTPS